MQTGIRLAAGRAVLVAGLTCGAAGALAIPTTGAQAFGLGDITGAVTGVAKGAVDAAAGVAKGAIDTAGRAVNGAGRAAGRAVNGAGRAAGRAVKGAAKKVDGVMRNGVSVGGVNVRPACPYFVGCKVDSKGRIVVDVSKRKRTKVRVISSSPRARGDRKVPPARQTAGRPASSGDRKLPLPRRANERVPVSKRPVRKVKGITIDDIRPSGTCKAAHCKPKKGKGPAGKRDVGRDKSVWGRPVGVKKSHNVRDHRTTGGQAKRITRDHRTTGRQAKRTIRDHRTSGGQKTRVIRDHRKSGGQTTRVVRDHRKAKRADNSPRTRQTRRTN